MHNIAWSFWSLSLFVSCFLTNLIKNKKSSDINNVSTIVSDSINSIDNSTDDLSNTIPSQENVDKNKIKEAFKLLCGEE